ncbi:LLM class flavin-dependent oxidoreductase [Streptomyces sp. NPDC005890]|uniref:LLM class flavin-dependent oxidoreductase n=1 Tax=Streptomyces sp. NPDC005890 TaxID=3154568 RepID=UPI0033F7CE73
MPEPATPVPLFVALSATPRPAAAPDGCAPRHPLPASEAGLWLRRLSDAAVGADRAGVEALVIRRNDAVGSAALEPTGVLAAIAPRTTGIGLVAEASPVSHEPYHLARELATLDIMSGGRAGLLLDPQPDATERATCLLVRQGAPAARRRAEEYLGVLQGLWDSFDDDAFVHDRATGVYFRAHGMHPLDHDGPHYRVAGPLNIARPPQGHPVTLAAWGTCADPAGLPDYQITNRPTPSRTPRIAPLSLAAEPPEDTVARIRRLLHEERPTGLLIDLLGGPASLEFFAARTLPMLREHGLVPCASRAARTLRSRLGLERPADRPARRSA